MRLVVEHLLEVRHAPLGVCGVAVKAAADLVVDAAGRHPLQRVQNDALHLGIGKALGRGHQHLQAQARGKLGRASEAAVNRVVADLDSG